MGEGPVVALAVLGGIVAAACAVACAVACAWLARAAQSSPHVRSHSTPATSVMLAPQTHPVVVAQQPVVLPPAAAHAQVPRGQPIVLQGRYPQLGAALGTWLQMEPDDVERTRIAYDLGTVGGADAARALLDGVRTGVLAPTVAADHLERGGFEAGVTVAAALGDPEPRVRALASSLVGRSAPLQMVHVTPRPMPPIPDPPSRADA